MQRGSSVATAKFFTEKYIIYPKFLFYVDSTLLCGTFQGGEDEIIHFHEI